MTTYAFRVRVDRSPTDTIECPESEIPLADSGLVRVYLRNKMPDEPLKGAQHLVLVGTGYATETDAKRAGEVYERVLMVALARTRVGVDFGNRAARGSFTNEGLTWLEQDGGSRVLNDVHGLMTYAAEPKPRFAMLRATPLRGVAKETFLAAFKAADDAQPKITDRERLAFTLFNASFFQPTVDSRFLLLVMAVEALIEPAPRSAESQALVRLLEATTKATKIPTAERESMLGTIKWLDKESIGQAGKRIVTSRLGTREYAGRIAADFFSHVYRMRSHLVHGNQPYPTFETVSIAAANLEVFVSDLLTTPVLGSPEDKS